MDGFGAYEELAAALRRLLLWALCALGSCASGLSGATEAPPGVPRELAEQRAVLVSNLRYQVHYLLLPHAREAPAEERVWFSLAAAAQPLLIDFRDGRVASLSINGRTVPVEQSNGHLILPAARLRRGENRLEIRFAASVASAGKSITRFEDGDDGSEYIHTLFVPMDASMAFPCFDQPDLKGRFRLTLTAPSQWTVISNTAAETRRSSSSGAVTTVFAETRPISTYLFAFAAGPFVNIHRERGLPGVYVRKSKAATASAEVLAIQKTAAEGMRYLSSYFAQPFPFTKYDMVLIPGFAYAGMEHAGATFLREESVLFRFAPTETNLLRRDALVLHELTHQWFGDLTTMRWFDDLWLKEGFAEYMTYRTLAALRPEIEIWKRFYEEIKPAAYGIDATQGTTPIYQNIPNLSDAKSAYGAIVYSKAPGVLKQLAYVLGEEEFRGGLQRYLAEHLYGNANWSDLIGALEGVSGRSLQSWAESWIRNRGMPEIDVAWACEGGRVARIELTQHDVLGTERLWPIGSEILLGYAAGNTLAVRAQWDTKTATVADAIGKPCPEYVFANGHDYAYGLFMLDDRSRDYVTRNLGSLPDVFERTLLWGSIWQSVRTAAFSPQQYVHLALENIPLERDSSLTASVVARSEFAIHRYLGEGSRSELMRQLQGIAAERVVSEADRDLRIIWFRALTGVAEQPAGRDVLRKLLKGSLQVPGVPLRQQDRWMLITAMIAYGDTEADALFAAEQRRDVSADAEKYAYLAQAARPDPASKARYFNEYLHRADMPEDWIEESLESFNYWNQSALTSPYLEPALAALPQIKQQRKIFFLLRWLSAFIEGQQSAAAQQQVHRYLGSTTMDPDLRLKVLQAVDDLDRTVAIRGRYAPGEL